MHHSRLLLSRILVGALVAIAITSRHVYAEEAIADLVMEIGGYVLLGVSAMGRAWASAYVAGRKNQVLVQDGPYSITRHPLYFSVSSDSSARVWRSSRWRSRAAWSSSSF